MAAGAKSYRKDLTGNQHYQSLAERNAHPLHARRERVQYFFVAETGFTYHLVGGITNNKFVKYVKETTGQSEEDIMSQKAVTAEFGKIRQVPPGIQGQIVGFDVDGNPVVNDLTAGITKFTADNLPYWNNNTSPENVKTALQQLAGRLPLPGQNQGTSLFVSTTGSDTTGKRGKIGLPYLTLDAAITAAQDGDSIILWPGTYGGVTSAVTWGLETLTFIGIGYVKINGNIDTFGGGKAICHNLTTQIFVRNGGSIEARNCVITLGGRFSSVTDVILIGNRITGSLRGIDDAKKFVFSGNYMEVDVSAYCLTAPQSGESHIYGNVIINKNTVDGKGVFFRDRSYGYFSNNTVVSLLYNIGSETDFSPAGSPRRILGNTFKMTTTDAAYGTHIEEIATQPYKPKLALLNNNYNMANFFDPLALPTHEIVNNVNNNQVL